MSRRVVGLSFTDHSAAVEQALALVVAQADELVAGGWQGAVEAAPLPHARIVGAPRGIAADQHLIGVDDALPVELVAAYDVRLAIDAGQEIAAGTHVHRQSHDRIVDGLPMHLGQHGVGPEQYGNVYVYHLLVPVTYAQARRHADRGASAGHRQSDRATVDGRACRPRSPAPASARWWPTATSSTGSASSTPIRCWSAAMPPRHACECAHAAAARLRRRLAIRPGDKLVCLRRQQAQGPSTTGRCHLRWKERPTTQPRHQSDAAAAGRRLSARASRCRCGRNASSAASRKSNGRCESGLMSSTTATC